MSGGCRGMGNEFPEGIACICTQEVLQSARDEQAGDLSIVGKYIFAGLGNEIIDFADVYVYCSVYFYNQSFNGGVVGLLGVL